MIKKFISQFQRRFRAIFLFILLLFGINACEKDDICVEGDTALLIIRFYDAENPEEFKSVTNLRVTGLGQDNPVDTFTDRSTLDSISIPLRINEPDTGFEFISESESEDDVEIGNIDTLTFSYTTEEVFVSRACGFIANYTELSDALSVDGDNWIQSIEIISPTVNSIDAAHVYVYHIDYFLCSAYALPLGRKAQAVIRPRTAWNINRSMGYELGST